jgi:hypothetical protein
MLQICCRTHAYGLNSPMWDTYLWEASVPVILTNDDDEED